MFSSASYGEEQIWILNIEFTRLASFLEFATTKKVRERSLNVFLEKFTGRIGPAICCVLYGGELKHASTRQLIQSKLLGTSGCTHWNKQEGSHCFQCAWKWDTGSSPVQADGKTPIASLGAGFCTRFC